MQNNDKVSDKSLSRIILSSIAGILICGVCLASLTWAWFSSSVTSISNNITTASFSPRFIFQPNGTDSHPVEVGDGSYQLNSGVYTVTITADGSASTGYCNVKLKLSDNDIYTYHTVQLYPGDGSGGSPSTVVFTIKATNTFYLTVTSQWGTYAKPDGEALIGNSEGDITVIPQRSSSSLSNTRTEETQTYPLTETEQSYTIKQGDTLTKIAQMYGSRVDILSTYNNIKNPDKIQAGAILKIPPASYTIPVTTTTETTTAETTTAETTTAETTTAETTAAETIAVETTTAETTTAETTTVETTAVVGQ